MSSPPTPMIDNTSAQKEGRAAFLDRLQSSNSSLPITPTAPVPSESFEELHLDPSSLNFLLQNNLTPTSSSESESKPSSAEEELNFDASTLEYFKQNNLSPATPKSDELKHDESSKIYLNQNNLSPHPTTPSPPTLSSKGEPPPNLNTLIQSLILNSKIQTLETKYLLEKSRIDHLSMQEDFLRRYASLNATQAFANLDSKSKSEVRSRYVPRSSSSSSSLPNNRPPHRTGSRNPRRYRNPNFNPSLLHPGLNAPTILKFIPYAFHPLIYHFPQFIAYVIQGSKSRRDREGRLEFEGLRPPGEAGPVYNPPARLNNGDEDDVVDVVRFEDELERYDIGYDKAVKEFKEKTREKFWCQGYTEKNQPRPLPNEVLLYNWVEPYPTPPRRAGAAIPVPTPTPAPSNHKNEDDDDDYDDQEEVQDLDPWSGIEPRKVPYWWDYIDLPVLLRVLFVGFLVGRRLGRRIQGPPRGFTSLKERVNNAVTKVKKVLALANDSVQAAVNARVGGGLAAGEDALLQNAEAVVDALDLLSFSDLFFSLLFYLTPTAALPYILMVTSMVYDNWIVLIGGYAIYLYQVGFVTDQVVRLRKGWVFWRKGGSKGLKLREERRRKRDEVEGNVNVNAGDRDADAEVNSELPTPINAYANDAATQQTIPHPIVAQYLSFLPPPILSFVFDGVLPRPPVLNLDDVNPISVLISNLKEICIFVGASGVSLWPGWVVKVLEVVVVEGEAEVEVEGEMEVNVDNNDEDNEEGNDDDDDDSSNDNDESDVAEEVEEEEEEVENGDEMNVSSPRDGDPSFGERQ